MKRLALIVFIVAFRLVAAEGEHEPSDLKTGGASPEAPAKAAVAFPCDLTKGPNPPFRLIQADSKTEEGLSLDLLKRAGTGEIYFAFENPRGGSVAEYLKANEPEADSLKATLFSSDDGFIQGFLESTSQYVNLRRALQAFRESKTSPFGKKRSNSLKEITKATTWAKGQALNGIRSNHFYAEAWQSMDRSAFSTEAGTLSASGNRRCERRRRRGIL